MLLVCMLEIDRKPVSRQRNSFRPFPQAIRFLQLFSILNVSALRLISKHAASFEPSHVFQICKRD